MRVGQIRKRDLNEPAIVAALRAVGATVIQISAAGAPDLLVAFRGRWTPLEIKRPRGKLTPAQRELWLIAQFPICETVEQALRAIGAAP